MAATPTVRNRLQKQATGTNLNTWGQVLNTTGLDLIDEALDGIEVIAITGNHTLVSINFATDQARKRILKFTGSVPATITIPSVSKTYFIWNATNSTLTFTTGGDVNANLAAGAKQWVMCDGAGVHTDTSAPIAVAGAVSASISAANADEDAESAAASAATATTAASAASASATSAGNSATAAAQSAANAAASSGIPSQTGNAGKYLTTNGTTASWGSVSTTAWTQVSSTTAVGVASVSQTNLAAYNELLVVHTGVNHNNGSSQSLVIFTSQDNGSTFPNSKSVSNAVVAAANISGATHINLTDKATMMTTSDNGSAITANGFIAQSAKANAIRIQWGAGNFGSGTGNITIYAR